MFVLNDNPLSLNSKGAYAIKFNWPVKQGLAHDEGDLEHWVTQRMLRDAAAYVEQVNEGTMKMERNFLMISRTRARKRYPRVRASNKGYRKGGNEGIRRKAKKGGPKGPDVYWEA